MKQILNSKTIIRKTRLTKYSQSFSFPMLTLNVGSSS